MIALSQDEAAAGCGLCEKVCPVDNIRLENGRPQWKQSLRTLRGLHQTGVLEKQSSMAKPTIGPQAISSPGTYP